VFAFEAAAVQKLKIRHIATVAEPLQQPVLSAGTFFKNGWLDARQTDSPEARQRWAHDSCPLLKDRPAARERAQSQPRGGGCWYHLKRAFRPEADPYKEGRNKSQ